MPLSFPAHGQKDYGPNYENQEDTSLVRLNQRRGRVGSIRVGYFGDSISSYNDTFQQYLKISSDQRVVTAGIASYPGYTSTQLVPLVGEAMQTFDRPDAVLVLAGSNDALGATPTSTFIANMRKIVSAFQDQGVTVLIGTTPPINNSTNAAAVARYYVGINRLARELGVLVVDFHAVLVDKANGQYLANHGSSVDGVHPTSTGLTKMGTAAWNVFKNLLPDVVVPLALNLPVGANMDTVSQMLTDSNADGVPDNWSGAAVTGETRSLVADPAGFNWQRRVFSGSTSTSTLKRTINALNNFADGDRLSVSILLDQTITTNTKRTIIQAAFYNASSTLLSANQLCNIQQSVKGTVSGDVVVPSGTSRLELTVECYSGDGTVNVALPTFVNLTSLGLV